MIRRMFRRCGYASGALSPEDQAAVDAFLKLLPALKNPQPWGPDSGADIAVRVGPFIERAHPRPGDDDHPVAIAVSLRHPDEAGHPLGTGWLRCERNLVIGTWQPAYRMLTHAAYGLELPEQPLPPAHYAVHVTRPGRPPLRIGPYNQCHHADYAAARLRQQLPKSGAAAAVPFDFGAIGTYYDPHRQDVDDLVAQELSTDPTHET